MSRYAFVGWTVIVLGLYLRLYGDLFPAMLRVVGL